MNRPSFSLIVALSSVVPGFLVTRVAAQPAPPSPPVPAVTAEDWGAYSLTPFSAKGMVLEAVGAGKVDGTVVSIGTPTGATHQKWLITAKGANLFSIKPTHAPELVLAVAKGGNKTGSPIVLEADTDQPWQKWSLAKHEDGSYSLKPSHAPDMGVDDFGGNQQPGARIDLWKDLGRDAHLHWIIEPLAGSTVAATKEEPEAKKYEPPPIKPEDIKHGVTKEFRFIESTIFPGTVRDVTVFIPAQYDGSKPACVYVKTDGYNAREQALIETMIATGEMPVTVGVFVRPGDLPAPMKATLGRRNRCFEYDGVDDSNVRFFIDELLPYVAKEFSLKLSTDANDRCVSGGSSGGITAFNAAWQRPDAFSRVYAASGSFVAFRGGHEFPTLVRKTEPKAIRSFLSTGTRDMENAAGDWFLLDQEMDKALKFSGYDYIFRIVDGGHGAGHMENFQEAMSYLWKGWPERVKAGEGAPRVRDVLLPDEPWQLLAQGFKEARGAACNAQGEVFFADPPANKIRRIDLEGKITDIVADSGHANGLTVAADGKLLAVSSETGKIMSYDTAGVGSVVTEGIHGHSILAMPNGVLLVTAKSDNASEADVVWCVKDGKKTMVDTGIKHATGLAYRPDQWLLSVADGASKWAYSYQMDGDGKLTNKERYFWLHVADWDDNAGAESVCYAREGQMFVATRSGIQVCAEDGPTQVILPLPDRSRVLSVCLGGKDGDTLFAFCGDKILKRKVKPHALGAFTPWTPVAPTKL